MGGRRSLLGLHAAVMLFGVAGLFGKWLEIAPVFIVAGRVWFAALALTILMLLLKTPFRLTWRMNALLFMAGGMLGFHWLAFFKSIQLSTVAIGLLTYATFPVFVSLIDPFISRRKLQFGDYIAVMLSLAGVFLIVPEFTLSNKQTLGIVWGLLSGLSFAILALFNQQYVKKTSGMVLAFYEDLYAGIILLPFLFFAGTFEATVSTWLLLVLLGVVFTAIAHTLFIRGLRHIRATYAAIIANMEPVYGIILAVVIFGEYPDWHVVLGGVMVLGAAFYVTLKETSGHSFQ